MINIPLTPRGRGMAWKFSLLASMEDPKLRIFADDEMVVIKDKYPKSELHYLVLPKAKINDLKNLDKKHVPLLRRMEAKGRELARQNLPSISIKVGYHAMPSLQRLHLHVISDDYNSPALKTLKHWNSFTTSFFLPSSKVIQDLESVGKVLIPSKLECERLLKSELKCHKCGVKQKNMPTLKNHIKEHIDG